MMLAVGDDRGAEGRLRYQELFDFAPEGYVVTDAAGLIEQINHSAAALLKARREFLVGKPMGYLVKPISEADLKTAITMAMLRFQHFLAMLKETTDLK